MADQIPQGDLEVAGEMNPYMHLHFVPHLPSTTTDIVGMELIGKPSAWNLKNHKQTMPRLQQSHTFKQHKCKETVKRASSFILSTILILRILSDIYCLCQSPMFKVQQQLHQEQHGPVSIWPSLLSLFGFMVFVWAVAVMILVQAPFTRMQRVMLVFWGILMHVRSASSISGMYFLILGIFLMGWQMMKEK